MREKSQCEVLSVIEMQCVMINEHISMNCCVISPRKLLFFLLNPSRDKFLNQKQ